MLLVIAEIFLIPSLSGPAGCFRVSGIGEGGNMAEGGNVWQEDWADLYCVLSVQSLSPQCRVCFMEPSPCNYANVNVTELGGDTNTLIPDRMCLMYFITVQGRRLSVDLIGDMAVYLRFSLNKLTHGKPLCKWLNVDTHTHSLYFLTPLSNAKLLHWH